MPLCKSVIYLFLLCCKVVPWPSKLLYLGQDYYVAYGYVYLEIILNFILLCKQEVIMSYFGLLVVSSVKRQENHISSSV